ncbi:alkaline phosphatase D family protein [Prauserella oleivorans]
MVLWTRLAPDPLAEGGLGGMPRDKRYVLRWQVAEDEQFRRVVKHGTATATPELGYSVHPEVWGLRPGRHYYYRFMLGNEISPVGRTKTAPAVGAAISSLTFAFASCQEWSSGFYTAHRHLAEQDLDVAIHLGDYLYESAINAHGGARNQPVPEHFRSETITLERYRIQYALYKSDPDLIAAHHAHPWIVTLDDHEVENDWAGEVPEASSQTKGELWMPRRAAAFQAYYENLPLRAAQLPDGPDMQLYRKLSYGNLVDFNVLDTRQYRDDQIADTWDGPQTPEAYEPRRTILGWEQEGWLLNNFARSKARWQVLANQAPLAETVTHWDPVKTVTIDNWDSYVANRQRVLNGARERGVENLIVITGDRHQNNVLNLKADYDDPDSPVVGAEFVGNSITSGGNGADMTEEGRRMLANNPHLKFWNQQRGYVRCTVTKDLWTSDFLVLPSVTEPNAPVSTRASYVVENGVPGATLDTERPVG